MQKVHGEKPAEMQTPIKDLSPDLRKLIIVKYNKQLQRHYRNILQHVPDMLPMIKEYIQDYRKNYIMSISITDVIRHTTGKGSRFMYVVFRLHPGLYAFLVKFELLVKRPLKKLKKRLYGKS